MTGFAAAGAVVQTVLVVAGAPILTGLMRQVRARLEGRAGPGVRQPWRDLRKLLRRKESLTPRGTGQVFRAAPVLLMATTLL
ncbi:NADH-quinone oxidoreductase subunit H, partial [Amycolatopsis sp. M39]